MFTATVSGILFADALIKILIGLGIVGFIGAVVCWFLLYAECDHPKLVAWGSVILILIGISTVVVGNMRRFQPEYIIALQAAPAIDKYVEAHPESIYNPDVILGKTSDAALGILSSLQEFPNVLSKLAAGKSIPEIKAENEMAEFEAWKRAKDK